jgi:amino acid adenylation domain-containing protein
MDERVSPNTSVAEFESEWLEPSIHGRFEKIVRNYPERLAVKTANHAFTYKELNCTANRIAYAILDRMGRDNEPVAVLCEHGIDVIAAIFGVLKAGKFYVAIDPSSPADRVGYILEDSQAKLIVTNSRNINLALSQAGDARALLNIDEIDGRFADDNVEVFVAPDDLLLIGYTSGSTGVPKGVVATHRVVAQTIRSAAERKHIGVDDRLTLLHSLAFGSGHGHLYIALLHGASVFPFDVKLEGVERLAQWLCQEKITLYHSSPSLFRQVVESLAERDNLQDLRLVHLSGAPVTRLDFELYRSNFGPQTLLEFGMGSTEARGICSAIVDQTFAYPVEGTPIGYARRHHKVLLLDQNGREVRTGEIGEIAVKSRNLTSGYWNQPDLTETKFQPTGNDERLFLTGDLGCMRADGFLIHLGRKDLMVKIRGYRVDISEIERAMLEHPGIKDAGVRAWERIPGEKCLAAYMVPRRGFALNVSEVRDFLGKKLPDYMIPSAFTPMETLPLTNGKLDRQKLPQPDTKRPALRETYIAPRNEVEKRLAGIWSEVLQIDPIGVHDNFFDLGGHSLTASRVLSRVLERFRVEVSLKSLFESPTVAGLAQHVESALHQRLDATNSSLVSVPREYLLPTTFGQQALWFHDQLEPGSVAYNLLCGYRLDGELDAQLLEQSINQIIVRHEVLRTIFEVVDGQPNQKILPVLTVDMEMSDLGHLASESLQESEVRRLAGTLATQSFDLARGPLLRPALLRLADNEYVFLVAVHHIVFDGWSIGIFLGELFQIYNSLRNGKPCPLPELRIQYADFAVWQRERLHDANLESSLNYWKAQLDNLPTLMLPIKRAQNIPDCPSGGREEFEVSRELLDGLRGLANRSGTTLFMVLLAAWKIVLHRYTGQTDIAIGTPVAGRNHPAVENLIGYFLNLVVLRSDLSGDPTVPELLERIRRVCLDAFSHQDVPFEKLVEELRPARHVATNPLVQASFALQNTPKGSLNLSGIAARDLDISAGVARAFDLHLYMIEEETRLRGYIGYKSNLFEADTIQRLTSHLKNILRAIAADQDQRIGALPMLTETERLQLLIDWNGTEAEYPKDKCCHELFEAQVERTPDAVAVVFEDQKLTYRELNAWANQLAYYLRKLGVGPEVLVGIYMQRSAEMVVALLSVLKAGGAYVPLDPTYPETRLALMIEDAQPKVLLTQTCLCEKLPASGGKVLCLDGERDVIVRESGGNLDNESTPSDLAYVIYTSGSTGQPKGVMISHRAMVNHMLWMQETFRFTGTDSVVQKTPISFDASVWEMFAPLLAGSRLILAHPEGHRDSACLSRLIQNQNATVLQLVPSMLREMLQDKAFSACTTLRLVFCGGEVVPADLPSKFHACFGSTPTLWNLYGPTEATIDATYWECKPNLEQTRIPIGRPIANTQIFIFDSHLHPVPIGVIGELCIGGAGLARGYLNRPELTKEKFIAHPFSTEPGARLYKTGDLARYLPDGNIEFFGRIDDQVKIRGYRIELGEIEATLKQQVGVEDGIVVAKEFSAGDARLVAYWVEAPGYVLDINETKRFLRKTLPEYMIPSVWVKLVSLPRLPNGKIDRTALPAPGVAQSDRLDAISAAWTPLEKLLAEVWAEVLKPATNFGIHDSFFDLGGHSLLATQVVARLGKMLNTEIPLRFLFEAPTIRELALRIEAHHEIRLTAGEGLFELKSPTGEETQTVI